MEFFSVFNAEFSMMHPFLFRNIESELSVDRTMPKRSSIVQNNIRKRNAEMFCDDRCSISRNVMDLILDKIYQNPVRVLQCVNVIIWISQNFLVGKIHLLRCVQDVDHYRQNLGSHFLWKFPN